jgi:hypothetical protein
MPRSRQVEVVADDGAALGHHLVGQRDIERLADSDLLRTGRHLRIAERQARIPEAFDHLQEGEVELHLAVESADHRVEVIPMADAEIRASPEHVGMQLGDTVEDPGLDVVHLGVVGQPR